MYAIPTRWTYRLSCNPRHTGMWLVEQEEAPKEHYQLSLAHRWSNRAPIVLRASTTSGSTSRSAGEIEPTSKPWSRPNITTKLLSSCARRRETTQSTLELKKLALIFGLFGFVPRQGNPRPPRNLTPWIVSMVFGCTCKQPGPGFVKSYSTWYTVTVQGERRCVPTRVLPGSDNPALPWLYRFLLPSFFLFLFWICCICQCLLKRLWSFSILNMNPGSSCIDHNRNYGDCSSHGLHRGSSPYKRSVRINPHAVEPVSQISLMVQMVPH